MDGDRAIDISAILRELDADIAEAEQRYTEAQRRLDDLRGQRRGVLLVLERGQRQPPIITEGEVRPAEERPGDGMARAARRG